MGTSSLKFKVRCMYGKDIAQVLEIEQLNFPQPYSQAILEQELKITAAHLRVATLSRRILGYIDFWHLGEEVELVSIAVHPKYHGQGVAQALMLAMINFAKTHRVESIILDVRTRNLKAQKLYKKFNFKPIGVRKRYYSDNREDAIIMKLDCG